MTTTSFTFSFINFSLLLLLLLYLPNYPNRDYSDTGLDKLSAQHKGGLVSVAWETVVSDHGAVTAKTGNPLAIFWFLSILLI